MTEQEQEQARAGVERAYERSENAVTLGLTPGARRGFAHRKARVQAGALGPGRDGFSQTDAELAAGEVDAQVRLGTLRQSVMPVPSAVVAGIRERLGLAPAGGMASTTLLTAWWYPHHALHPPRQRRSRRERATSPSSFGARQPPSSGARASLARAGIDPSCGSDSPARLSFPRTRGDRPGKV